MNRKVINLDITHSKNTFYQYLLSIKCLEQKLPITLSLFFIYRDIISAPTFQLYHTYNLFCNNISKKRGYVIYTLTTEKPTGWVFCRYFLPFVIPIKLILFCYLFLLYTFPADINLIRFIELIKGILEFLKCNTSDIMELFC